jgi:hypothetical protein
MALDFGMLQPVNIGGQIMAGQQEAQRNQLARQQLVAGQQQMRTAALQEQHTGMQLEQAMREREALDKMQKAFIANGKSGDLNANFTEMMNSGIPHFVDIGVKGLQTLKNQQNFEALLKGGAPAAAPTPAAAPAPGTLGSGTFDPNVAPVRPPTPITGTPLPTNQLAPSTAPAAAASVNQLSPDVANLRRQIDAAYSLGTPQALAWAQSREKELAEITKPQTAPDATLMKQLGYPLTQAGYQAFRDAQRQERILSPEEEKQKVRIAAASRQPAQPTAPIAVIDPVTKQAVYVSREEALRNKMQPAANAPALKPLTEGQEIKLRTDVGKDYKAATTALSQMDDLLDSIEAVKTAPGLAAATGYTGKYLPSFSEGAAAQAETRIANLRGKVTALGKATAAMSGSIGSIANQEWKILSDQIAALDEVKGKGPLLEQIGLVEQQARGAIERIRDTYEKTRSEDFERFPQFRDLPQPRGKKDSGGGNIDALLDKYK